jgi:glycosyltransferase involved in cell wall biosynthesis
MMTALNLLYDYQTFTFQKYGGISRYYYELISRLSFKDNLRISLFLGAYINEYGLENYRGKFERFWGLKHRSIRYTGILFSHLNKMLFNSLIDRKKKYIYHQTYYSYLGRTLDCKRVLTVYDMIHERYPRQFSLLDSTIRDKKRSVLNADAIISISESTRKDLIHFYNIPENRIKVIYLGNSLNFEVTTSRTVKNPYILYVGFREGYKNFNLLLSAFAKSSRMNKDFKLICFGGRTFSNQEHALIDSCGLNGKILHYSGDDRALANLYKYADALVYPSLYEGFGIPPLEAMHYGCPVVVSNTSSIPEVVGEAGLYFNPVELDDLIFQLEKVLYDSLVKRKLSEMGRQQEKKFSWDTCAQETLQLYKGLQV